MLNTVSLVNTTSLNGVEYGCKADHLGRVSYFILTTLKSGKYKGIPQWKRIIQRNVPTIVIQQLTK